MPETFHTKLLARKISDFFRLRVDPMLPPQESERIRDYLLGLIARSQIPPRKLRGYDWDEISLQCDLDKEAMRIASAAIEPALDAIVRNTKNLPKRSSRTLPYSFDPSLPSTGSANVTPWVKSEPPGEAGSCVIVISLGRRAIILRNFRRSFRFSRKQQSMRLVTRSLSALVRAARRHAVMRPLDNDAGALIDAFAGKKFPSLFIARGNIREPMAEGQRHPSQTFSRH
jgi:hypothetical protein